MIFWIYLAGYLFFWRYFVGTLAAEFSGRVDAEALGLGSIICMMWPLVVPCYLACGLWQKYELENVLSSSNFFRSAPEFESKTEKRERIEREKRLAVAARQRYINEKEEELGITPTVWETT